MCFPNVFFTNLLTSMILMFIYYRYKSITADIKDHCKVTSLTVKNYFYLYFIKCLLY